MNKNMFETLMGALVLAIAIGFMVFAYQSSGMKPVEGYTLKAQFSTVAGVGTGTDVRLAGIKVGIVSDMTLDQKSYKAVLTLQIKNGINLPDDTSASVVSDGLLGSKYVKLEPGADEKMLASGGEITITQSSVNLEELIGKMAFGGVDANSKKPPATPSATAPAPAQP